MFFGVIVSIFFLLSIYFIKHRLQTRRLRAMVNKFNGPSTIPIFGNIHQFVGSSTGMFKAAGRESLMQFNGKPIRVWIFHKPYVILSNPKDIQLAARSLQKEPFIYKFIGDFIGDGLISASPEKWKKSRLLMNPAFNMSAILGPYLHVFNKQNLRLIEMLKNDAGPGKTFDLWPLVLQNSVRSIYETFMGLDEDIHEGAFENFERQSAKCDKIISKRCYSPWLYPSLIFNIYLHCIGGHKLIKEVRSFHSEVIQKKKQIFKNRTNSNANADEKHKPIIDLLLETTNLSDEELTDEIMALIFAGSETTAVTVSFTLFMLAKHQDIQEKVYQELYEVFGNSDRLVEAADLPKLPFLEMCIKETLRKYTVIPFILRQATEDIILSDESIIPRGAGIFMSLHAVHHNPIFYDDDNTWNPLHYDAANVENRPMNTFLPFGIGPRMCIGYKYAMTAMKALISTFVRNFKISTTQTNIKLNKNFILKSSNGYHVELTRR